MHVALLTGGWGHMKVWREVSGQMQSRALQVEWWKESELRKKIK